MEHKMGDVSAEKIVSIITELIHPRSVVEIGCRDGALLQEFHRKGIRIHGIDSPEYKKAPFWEQNKSFFSSVNLEKLRVQCKEKLDLAVSLERVSDFGENQSNLFIHNLCTLSDVVLFSAAIPGQDGDDHGNQQMPSYWIKIFRENGFLVLDCIRPLIWENKEIDVRYRQNVLLFVREVALNKYPKLFRYSVLQTTDKYYDVVHPEMWYSIDRKAKKYLKLYQEHRPRKVLYTFDTNIAFGWALTHRLMIHSTDEAYLLVHVAVFKNSIQRFVDEGIFRRIYIYNRNLGLSCSTLKETEKEILNTIDATLLQQDCDINSYDIIYSCTDTYDTMGLYLSMKKKEYYWFELFPNHHMHMHEALVRSYYSKMVGYRDALLKYKTLFGRGKYEFLVIHPDSDRTISSGFPEKRCTLFNAEQISIMFSYSNKSTIMKCFELENAPHTPNDTWICVQSSAHAGLYLYPKIQFVQKKFKSFMLLYYYSIQVLCDYYVPCHTNPVIKSHPNNPINVSLSKRYFSGCFAYPSMFSMHLVSILPLEYAPEYVVFLGSTSNKQFPFHSKAIHCEGAWLFSFFYQKYISVLYVLSYINMLYTHTGEKFGTIGEEGRYMEYNTRLLKNDVNELIKVQFPNSPENCDGDYFVHQTDVALIHQEVEKHVFVIFTDVWEKVSVQEITTLANEIPTGIIRISKKPIKALEDIIVPLHNEYIFFFSKDASYLEKLKGFHASKTNQAMGIELDVNMISLEEYAKERAAE